MDLAVRSRSQAVKLSGAILMFALVLATSWLAALAGGTTVEPDATKEERFAADHRRIGAAAARVLLVPFLVIGLVLLLSGR